MSEQDSLPLAVAEALAFVGTERPLLPGKTAEDSALIMISAYLKKDTFPSAFGKLLHLAELHEKTAQVIFQKRHNGTVPSDYQSVVLEFDKVHIP